MEAEAAQRLRRALTRLVIDWASAGTQAGIAAIAEVGVDAVDIPALYLLAIEGQSRLGVLAARLRQSAPTTSKQLLRLQRHGLVVKREDPTDARAALFGLTHQGEETVAALDAVTDRAIADALAGLGGDAVGVAAQTTRLLERLLDRNPDSSPRPRLAVE